MKGQIYKIVKPLVVEEGVDTSGEVGAGVPVVVVGVVMPIQEKHFTTFSSREQTVETEK